MNTIPELNSLKYNKINSIFKQKAIKKPIPIEVIQITPEFLSEFDMCKIEGGHNTSLEIINEKLIVTSLEGFLKYKMYDYVVRGIEEEFYVIDKNVFERTYDCI